MRTAAICAALILAVAAAASRRAHAETGKLRQAVTVRERPGDTYRVIGKLPAGAVVDIARRKDDWIKLGGARGGWIPASALGPAPVSSERPTAAPAPRAERTKPAKSAPAAKPDKKKERPPSSPVAASPGGEASEIADPAAKDQSAPPPVVQAAKEEGPSETSPPPQPAPSSVPARDVSPPATARTKPAESYGEDEFASLEEVKPKRRNDATAMTAAPKAETPEAEASAEDEEAEEEDAGEEPIVRKPARPSRPPAEDSEDEDEEAEVGVKTGRTGPLFDVFAAGGYTSWSESVTASVNPDAVPLSNFSIRTGAFGISTGIGAGYNAGGFLLYADGAYRYFGAAPGLRISDPMTGKTIDLTVASHGVDLGARIGVRTNLLAVFARVGWTYTLIELDYSDQAPLPYDLVQSVVVGGGVDLLSLGSRATLRLRLDRAISPRREQDPDLADGTGQVSVSMNGSGLLTLRLARPLSLVAGVHVHYVDTQFEGASPRLKNASTTVDDTHRRTTVVMGTLGVGVFF